MSQRDQPHSQSQAKSKGKSLSTSVVEKVKNVYQRLRKGGKTSIAIKKLPTHEEEEEEQHTSSSSTTPPSDHRGGNEAEHSQQEPMMTGTIMFKSIMVLSVV